MRLEHDEMMKFFKKGAFFSGSFLMAAGLLLGMLCLPKQAQAQNCTGTEYACNTYAGNNWMTVPGSKAETSFSATTFTFNNSSSYPMTSDQTIERTSSPPIYLTITRSPSYAAQAQYFLEPSRNLRWNAARNGYNVLGYSEDVVLRFEARIHNNPFKAITGSGDTQLPLGADTATWVFNSGRRPQSQNINFSIKATAVLFGPLEGSINIPIITIFHMYGPGGRTGTTKGDLMGNVKIDGHPAIYIEPPKPKTCDAYTGGDKTFNLNRITIDQIAAAGAVSTESNTQTVTLNCPSGITLGLTLADANSSNSTADYLLSTGTAANAAVKMFYSGSTTPIIMKRQFATVTTNSDGAVNLPFTARYFNPVGATLGTGTVRSKATLTISYN